MLLGNKAGTMNCCESKLDFGVVYF